MKQTNFELEIWPDKEKMKIISFSIIAIVFLACISHLLGHVFWNDYSYLKTNLKGVTYPAGWPVTLYWWGIYIGLAGIISFLLIRIMVDYKNPSLAVSKNGIYINQQLIKKTMVDWNNIQKVEKVKQENEIQILIFFNDSRQVIDAQSGIGKTFLKENLKDGQPLKVSNKFLKGDFEKFHTICQHYLMES